MPADLRQKALVKRRYFVEWWLFLGFRALVWPLPLPLARGLLAGFFDLLGRLVTSQNQRIDRSLAVAFPDQSAAWRLQRRRRAWRNLGRSVAEIMKPAAARRGFETSSDLHLEPELSALNHDSRGTLLLMGHFGAWEALGPLAPQFRGKVLDIYRPLENPFIDAAVHRARVRSGAAFVSVYDPDVVRKAVRHLRAGGVLSLFADQRWATGEPLSLFGQPALTSLAAGLFQRAGDARVAVLFSRRVEGEPDRSYEVVLRPLQWHAEPEASWRVRGQAIMTAFHSEVEDWVRAHPDSWFWLQDRWKP